MKVTPEEMVRKLKGFYEGHITTLNGIMDKLPGAIRPEFEALKTGINAQLATLPPTDQVPAALDANYALDRLSAAIQYVGDMATGLVEKVKNLADKNLGLQTSLNGFEEKVTKGELIAKDKVAESVGLAREEG